MPIVAIDRRVLEGMSQRQLAKKIRQLDKAWVDCGRPPEDKCPVWILAANVALSQELARRGVQLSLF